MSDSPELPFISEKKTVELCPDEHHRGNRCILLRGHEGDHQYQDPGAVGVIKLLTR